VSPENPVPANDTEPGKKPGLRAWLSRAVGKVFRSETSPSPPATPVRPYLGDQWGSSTTQVSAQGSGFHIAPRDGVRVDTTVEVKSEEVSPGLPPPQWPGLRHASSDPVISRGVPKPPWGDRSSSLGWSDPLHSVGHISSDNLPAVGPKGPSGPPGQPGSSRTQSPQKRRSISGSISDGVPESSQTPRRSVQKREQAAKVVALTSVHPGEVKKVDIKRGKRKEFGL
jgi:hypothetical protein